MFCLHYLGIDPAADTKHLYNICTRSNIVQMLNKCFMFAGDRNAALYAAGATCLRLLSLKKLICEIIMLSFPGYLSAAQ